MDDWIDFYSESRDEQEEEEEEEAELNLFRIYTAIPLLLKNIIMTEP